MEVPVRELETREVKKLKTNNFLIDGFGFSSENNNSENIVIDTKNESLKSQLKRFLKEPCQTSEADFEFIISYPGKYWLSALSSTSFTTLSNAVRRRLSIQLTSAQTERVFSTAGQVWSVSRTRLAESRGEGIVLLK